MHRKRLHCEKTNNQFFFGHHYVTSFALTELECITAKQVCLAHISTCSCLHVSCSQKVFVTKHATVWLLRAQDASLWVSVFSCICVGHSPMAGAITSSLIKGQKQVAMMMGSFCPVARAILTTTSIMNRLHCLAPSMACLPFDKCVLHGYATSVLSHTD